MSRTILNIFYGVIIIFLFVITTSVYASQTYIIDPSDDGLIFKNGSVLNNSYITVGDGGVQGVIEFPLYTITAPISEAFLLVNPYGLPIQNLDLYGYESSDGILTSADYNAGVFLGTWTFPDDLGYGQDAFFEITTFLSQTTSTHVGFNMRYKDRGADLSSLEVNYGHPSQLQVTVVPEPISSTLFLVGAATIGFRRFRKK